MRIGFFAFSLLFAFSFISSAQQWNFNDNIIIGAQCDAVPGPDGKVHVIAAQYCQLDATGNKIASFPISDGHQNPMDYGPAIAVGNDGRVHAITRHGGSWNSGYTIKYQRRSAAGAWDKTYEVGKPKERNYVVGIDCKKLLEEAALKHLPLKMTNKHGYRWQVYKSNFLATQSNRLIVALPVPDTAENYLEPMDGQEIAVSFKKGYHNTHLLARLEVFGK